MKVCRANRQKINGKIIKRVRRNLKDFGGEYFFVFIEIIYTAEHYFHRNSRPTFYTWYI